MKAHTISVLTLVMASGLIGQAQTSTAPQKLPDVVVSGQGPSENDLIGENQQPEWTTQRRFATTRIYVMAPWQVEVEQWWKGKFLRDGGHEHSFQSEIEIGLPHRFQLDLYENFERTDRGSLRHTGNQVELRYALADWGKIPLNPTVYGEWKFNEHGADAFEVKLLLGGDIVQGLHWGINVFYEQEVGGDRESESGIAQGISYTVADGQLGVGVEMNIERTSHRNLHGSPETEVLLGPSIQWRPIPRMHLDLVPLFGITDDSPRVEAFVVLGFDLWTASKESGTYQPSSTRAR